MASNVFPNGTKTWIDKIDNQDDIYAAHINEAYAEIIAVETELNNGLSIAKGGTGATTVITALTNLLPIQTGNNGKALITDGENATWQTISTADEMVKASFTDTAGYLDAKVANSIEVNTNKLQLVGDNNTPGNIKYYGTNDSGTKGFFDFPSSSGGFEVWSGTGNDITLSNNNKEYHFISLLNNTNIILDTNVTEGKKFTLFVSSSSSSNRVTLYINSIIADYIYAYTKRSYIFNGTSWISAEEGGSLSNGNIKEDSVAIGGSTQKFNYTISIGNNSLVSNQNSIAIGYNAKSYGQGDTVIGMGASTESISGYNIAIGQYADTTSDSIFAIAIGRSAIADKSYSIAIGRDSKTSRIGELWRSITNNYNSFGHGIIGQSNITSTNTATILYFNNNTYNKFDLISNSALTFNTQIIADDNTNNVGKSWEIKGAIKNKAGTVTLIGTPTITVIGQDTGSETWTIEVSADDTNNCLSFIATGETEKTIRWNATTNYTEVRF